MEFNKEKFKNVLHYLIDSCENKDNVRKNVLYKLLYFADFNYFELYEKSLTNESYKKLPSGPIPTHFKLAIDELTQEGKIKETELKYLDKSKFHYSSLIKPKYSFSREEKEVIDSVINKLSHMSAKEISEYSHGDMPWRATEDYEIIDYGFVFYRDPEYTVRVYNDSN